MILLLTPELSKDKLKLIRMFSNYAVLFNGSIIEELDFINAWSSVFPFVQHNIRKGIIDFYHCCHTNPIKCKNDHLDCCKKEELVWCEKYKRAQIQKEARAFLIKLSFNSLYAAYMSLSVVFEGLEDEYFTLREDVEKDSKLVKDKGYSDTYKEKYNVMMTMLGKGRPNYEEHNKIEMASSHGRLMWKVNHYNNKVRTAKFFHKCLIKSVYWSPPFEFEGQVYSLVINLLEDKCYLVIGPPDSSFNEKRFATEGVNDRHLSDTHVVEFSKVQVSRDPREIQQKNLKTFSPVQTGYDNRLELFDINIEVDENDEDFDSDTIYISVEITSSVNPSCNETVEGAAGSL